jgi:hypothetical protein
LVGAVLGDLQDLDDAERGAEAAKGRVQLRVDLGHAAHDAGLFNLERPAPALTSQPGTSPAATASNQHERHAPSAWRSGEAPGMIVRRRASSRLLAAALIPLLLTVACAQPPDPQDGTTVTPPPPPKEPKKVSEPAPAQRADAADQAPTVERFCRSRFPDHYAALAVGKGQKSLIVYRRPLAGFDAAVRQQFPHLAMSFQDARYSQRELTAMVHRVLADTGYWRERGIEIQGVGPAGDGNSVLVTTSDVGRARKLLSQHYGLAVTVQPGGNVTLVPPFEGDPSEFPPSTSR